jgi:aminopeptidase
MCGQLADVAVRLGLDLQPGQDLVVLTDPGKEHLVRALARSAYQLGARLVDPWYGDAALQHVRLKHAPDSAIGTLPGWFGQRFESAAAEGAAFALLVGPGPEAPDDRVEPARAARDRWPIAPEFESIIGGGANAWCVLPCPTTTWARQLYGSEEALPRLTAELARACRLDQPDPLGHWQRRMDELAAVGAQLTSMELAAVHLYGDGTDLHVGLLSSSRWITARLDLRDGRSHVACIPSEETFTAPDPARTHGTLRLARPLALHGKLVCDAELTFVAGEVVHAQAGEGLALVEALLDSDDGARRLGEVALVDRSPERSDSPPFFRSALLDESACVHVALGSAYEQATDPIDHPRLNRSAAHEDLMVAHTDVDGVTHDDARIPLLRDGAWCLPAHRATSELSPGARPS